MHRIVTTPASFARRSPVLLVAALVATHAFPARAVHAQDVPEQELAKPTASIREGLKAPGAGVELTGGRLFFAERGAALHRADFATGKVETVMTPGLEDHQFRGAGPTIRWAGDSIAIVDAPKGRVMVFAPDGAFARFIRIGEPVPLPASGPVGRGATEAPAVTPRGPRIPILRFAAGTSHLVGTGFPRGAPPQPGTAAPARVPVPIVRYSLATLTYDTVAQILPAQAPRAPLPPNSSGVMTIFIPTTPFQTVDSYVAYRDGTVGVIRAGSYRVDFHAPDGTRTQGEPIGFPKIAIGDNEKKEFGNGFRKVTEEAIRRSAQRVQVSSFNYEEPSLWPSSHPPFRADVSPVLDADERTWLMVRCAKDEKATCYDVIARTGARVQRYRLPQHTQILAVGRDAVYTVDTAKPDKPVLHRHPLR